MRKGRPWNLEFGSPPSTLSCHLSLKNEYEEKYTATSVQGSSYEGLQGRGGWGQGKEPTLRLCRGHKVDPES